MKIEKPMSYSITQFGIPLDKRYYTIDEKNKIFSTEEDSLVLDFNCKNGWTFITNRYCSFFTGSHCTFKTSSFCTFNTDYFCAFDVGDCCTLLNWLNGKRYFLDDIYRYILYNDGILKLNNKNDALLNTRHDDEYVRKICNDIIKEK